MYEAHIPHNVIETRGGGGAGCQRWSILLTAVERDLSLEVVFKRFHPHEKKKKKTTATNKLTHSLTPRQRPEVAVRVSLLGRVDLGQQVVRAQSEPHAPTAAHPLHRDE